MESKNLLYCAHCCCYLSSKTWKVHKRLYYDQGKDAWLKHDKDEEEFEDSSGECPEHELNAFEADSEAAQGMADEIPPIVDMNNGDVCDEESMAADYTPDGESGETCEHNLDGPITEGLSEEIEVCEEEEEIDLFDDEIGRDEKNNETTHSSLVTWLLYLIGMLQRKFYISNMAIAILLKILSSFFNILGKMYPQILDIARLLPTTMYSFQLFLKRKHVSFVRYVVCSKCLAVYNYEDCAKKCGVRIESTRCLAKVGKHRYDTILMKPVRSATGKEWLSPYKTFCYMPLRHSLKHVLNRQGFIENCEAWRSRKITEGLMSSIYDGKVWMNFQEYKGKLFLSQSFTYGLMLNVDWFKPYKHLEYSVGAMYLTIMNLPRQMRFKQENVLLVGLIPGPREPSLTINNYLKPLVDELLELFEGIPLEIFGKLQLVRCALLCVACDIPASRKVNGFLGHAAQRGCSKCFKEFPGGIGQKNYSGFNVEQWPSRTNEQHRKDVTKIRKCKNRTQQASLESSLGCRYSALLDLPYFDPVRMAIIDPMHNLYLGTAKHVLKKIWHEKELISKTDFEGIQECVDSVHVPPRLGRLPSKILSSFSGLTADQLKNWTNIFSLFALHSRLPSNDLECWHHFVLASRILTQLEVTITDVELAHALLVQFCRRVERMYGSSVITPLICTYTVI